MKYQFFIFLIFFVLYVHSFNFFHNQAGVDIAGKLSFGGFSQIMSLYIGAPPQPIQCLVHGGDPFIVVNFDPSADGWNSATYFDEVLQVTMMYFTIGSFTGHLPVIYNYNYVYSFNNSAISCIFGLGRSNPIYWSSPTLHWGSTKIFFNEMSDSVNTIQCERFDDAMCTFNAAYKINGTVIGYAPTTLSNNVPYSLFPIDLFNILLLEFYASNYWNTVTICNETCFDIPSSSYILQLHNYIQKTIFPTNVNHSTLGVTIFRNLDVSVDSRKATITWKERSFALINSFGVFIIWSLFLGVFGFLVMTPSIRHIRIPKSYKMYSGVRTLTEMLVLIVPFFIFLIPDYYDNFVIEFGWFHYMFMSYLGIICTLGFVSMVFNQMFSSLTVMHYYLPIINSVFIVLLLSLFDFIEGSPTIIQTLYSFIISNYMFAISFSMCFSIEKRTWVYLPIGAFFFLMATGWSVFSSAYFVIPLLQQYIMIQSKYLYAFWPIKVLISMAFAKFHLGAAMSKNQIFLVRNASLKKRVKND